MKYKIFVGALMLVGAVSCRDRILKGTGSMKTEERQLGSGEFDKIRISAPLDAEIKVVEGNTSLQLRGYANVLPYLRTNIRDRTLHIFTDEHTDLSLRENISARISLPSLRGLEVSGAGNAKVSGPVRTQAFELQMSGAGYVDISELHAASLDADLSGASDLVLRNGEIRDANYELSGSGDIRAFGVNHQNVDVDLSGASSAELTVIGKLNAEISGAGSVRYKGHPTLTQDISGAGSISDAN